MIVLVAGLTIRALVVQRRFLVMVALALIPIAAAIVFRSQGDQVDAGRFTASALGSGMLVGAVLPLIAVVLGTSALGGEFEDGTAVYLLAKPIARWRIVVGKVLAASGLCVVLTVISGAVSITVSSQRPLEDGILGAFLVALALGSVAYTVVFVAVSVATGRALIAGLVYVFLWEGAVTSLFAGVRNLSIRQYTLGIVDALSDVPAADFEADLSARVAAGGLAIVTVAGFFLAVWLLSRWEIGDSG